MNFVATAGRNLYSSIVCEQASRVQRLAFHLKVGEGGLGSRPFPWHLLGHLSNLLLHKGGSEGDGVTVGVAVGRSRVATKCSSTRGR